MMYGQLMHDVAVRRQIAPDLPDTPHNVSSINNLGSQCSTYVYSSDAQIGRRWSTLVMRGVFPPSDLLEEWSPALA